MIRRDDPPTGPRLLVVEDELAMRVALEDALKAAGYRVLTAADGASGLEAGLAEKPDLVLLDVMLPRLDGLSVCAELRKRAVEAPVLLLTARGRVEDRVAGLDSGADDYLVKPFSTDELLARVRALIRRGQRRGSRPTTLTLDRLVIDLVAQTARCGNREVRLTAREYGMLRLLAEHRGEPVTRERFLDVVWGYTALPTTRTVDTHVAALRAKVESDPEKPRWITTVHGVGYRLEEETRADITKP
jgi:DNA-binding response OmpR family regulator